LCSSLPPDNEYRSPPCHLPVFEASCRYKEETSVRPEKAKILSVSIARGI
jgi:hypothetical protein